MLLHRLIGLVTRPLCSSSITNSNRRRVRPRVDVSVTAIVESLEPRRMLSAAPVIGGIEGAFTYAENSPPTPITPSLTLTDADSGTMSYATIQITSNYYARGKDLLSFVNTPNITGRWDEASGILTLSGSDTISNYEAALRSVSYQNLSSQPENTAGRVFAFQVSDGVNASEFGFQGMYFASMISHLTSGDASEVLGTPGIPITNSVDLTPSTSGTFASVSILDVYYVGENGNALASDGTLSAPGNWYAATGNLTSSNTNSAGNFQASMRSVTYKNLNLDPGSSPKFFQFVANYTTTPESGTPADLPQNLFAPHSGLNSNPINTPPVISHLEPVRASFSVNSSPIPITSTLSITDPDHTSLTSATVRIDTNYVNGEDILAFVDTARIAGSWDAATGTLTLTGTDTVTNYETALRSVTYQNVSNNPNTLIRRFALRANDGLTDSMPAYRYLEIVT